MTTFDLAETKTTYERKEDDPMNEDYLKDEDDLNNEDGPKNDDGSKIRRTQINKTAPKWRELLKWRPPSEDFFCRENFLNLLFMEKSFIAKLSSSCSSSQIHLNWDSPIISLKPPTT